MSDPHISKSQNRGEREKERERERKKERERKQKIRERNPRLNQEKHVAIKYFPRFTIPFLSLFDRTLFLLYQIKEEKFLGRVLMGHFCHRPLKNVTNEE